MTNENCLEGIRCPKCGNDDVFHIVCTTYAVVKDDGAEAYGDLEWNDESRTTCAECHLTAPLKEFRTSTVLPPAPEARVREAAPELLAACRMVVERWERGDLAAAARACAAAVEKANAS